MNAPMMAARPCQTPGPSSYTGPLILVNRQHPVHPKAAAPALKAVGFGPMGPVLLEAAAAAALTALLRAVGAAGHIAPVSGWRSMAQQQQLYRNAVRDFGDEYAATYVAWPGCSEHQSGLAVDMALLNGEIDPLTPAFPYEGICQAFRLAAPRFGFIQRYPKGARHITGIGHEPWHFRYVGAPHAELMAAGTPLAPGGQTLEAYLDGLAGRTLASGALRHRLGGCHWRVGCLPQHETLATTADALCAGYGAASCMLSGDNLGHIIATLRKEGR